MRYKYPHYYKEFKCSAQACEATCCAGWEIVIDDESIDEYLKVKSEFGNRLCNSIDFTEGIFHQDEKKRCAFLNEENLCDIYAELGEEALCYTCTQYPRHIEEFEDVNEVSLSISCPDVARMILGREEKVTFYEEEIEEEVEVFEDFDFLFYELLYEARVVLFQILQNREIPISHRMGLAQSMCAVIQEKINNYDTFSIDVIVQNYADVNQRWTLNGVEIGESEMAYAEVLYEEYQNIQARIMELYQLEVLQDTWRGYLLENQAKLYEMSYESYRKRRSAFEGEYGAILERMKEQLMIYFVYSYFCGAVYDGEVYCKYQLAHVTTQIIEEFWLAKYLEEGVITEEDMCRIVYRYAREIEHSDQNLDILEEIYAGKM